MNSGLGTENISLVYRLAGDVGKPVGAAGPTMGHISGELAVIESMY
jgi:hypothetical protein